MDYRTKDLLATIIVIGIILIGFVFFITHLSVKDRDVRCEEYKLCTNKGIEQFNCMYYTKVSAQEVVECEKKTEE